MPLRFRDMMTVAQALVPDLRKIALLGDPLERQPIYRHLRSEIPVEANGLKILDWTGVPMRELRERVAQLPKSTAIIYTAIYSDGEGTYYPPSEALRRIAEVANRPIVVSVETFIGRGGTGGFVMIHSLMGTDAAQLVLRILNGEVASKIPIARGDFVRSIFDWRQRAA